LSDPAGSVDVPPWVLVDVSNVAHGFPQVRPPKLRNVELVFEALRAANLRYSAWADGNLRYVIDRGDELADLIELGQIAEVQGEQADERLLAEANELLRSGTPVYLVSRDRYARHPEARGIPRVEFTFDTKDQVELRPPLKDLLRSTGYAAAHPDLMPLTGNTPCRHPRVKHQRTNGAVVTVCLRCGKSTASPSRDKAPIARRSR